MSKFLKLIGFIFTFLLTFTLFACDRTSLKFNENSMTISIGQEELLEVIASSDDLELEWESSDGAIVSVDSEGKITGLSVGTATITVSVRGTKVKATIQITVSGFSGTISFESATITVPVGTVRQLTPTITPAVSIPLSWSSSNIDIVTVDSTGKITAVAEGEANITVTLGDKSATIKVVVAKADPASIVIVGASSFHKMGTSVQLSAQVIPELAPQGVDWSSSDEDIATVDENGLVQFVGVGDVTITATSKAKNTVSKSVSITVLEPDPTSITVTTETGETEVFLFSYVQMIASVLPAQAQQGVTWSVSDPSIATIGAESGLLYAANTGTVTVTATSNVDESITGSLELTIVQTPPTQINVEGAYNVIQVEEELQLSTTVIPNLANQDVIFESSDESIATVDESGKIVGVAPGNVVITVKSAALETVTAEYELKVVAKLTVPEYSKIIFSSEFADLERYSEVKDDGDTFYLGINAFTSLDGVKLPKDGMELFFYPGEYTGTLTVDKKDIAFKSMNSGKNPNTDNYVRSNQPVIKGSILLADGVSGISFDGLAFSGLGKVKSLGGLTDFSFVNNFVFDIDEPATAWSALRNYDLEAVVALSKQGITIKDLYFANNYFKNVKRTSIFIAVVEDVEIENNIFENFTYDAIRVDGGYNYGYLILENNDFSCDVPETAHNGIYFRSLGHSKDSDNPHDVIVRNNSFVNIGIPDVIYSGAISSSSYQEYGLTIAVTNNYFENCTNYIMLRNNATEANHNNYAWIGVINFNVFVGEPLKYYYTNHTGEESSTTNPALVNMDYNFFGDADLNPLDLETISEKFIRVASLKYSFTDPLDMDAYYVDNDLEGTAEGQVINIFGREYKFGEKAFASIAAAVAAAPANSVIYVGPGSYDEDIVIEKALKLKTKNAALNPTVDDAPFKANSETAATITGVWAVNASNITIQGFSFTGAARVKSYGPSTLGDLNNFVFENNYVYDTDEATVAWAESSSVTTGSASADAAAPGFISLYPLYTWLNNYKFLNNKFSNVSDTHIFMVCVHNATFIGNVFSGGDRDGIRFEYAATYGNIVIEDNVFEDLAYNGVYIRSYVGSPYAGDLYVNVYNNTFKNIGSAAATQAVTSTRIGAISTRGYGETWSAYFNIKFNVFEDCANYISLRDNVTKYSDWAPKGKIWAAVIEYNAFIDVDGVDYYFQNLLNASDTEETNTGNVLINHNYYGTDIVNQAVIDEEQFGYHRAEESNLVVYETLSALLAAIAALEEGE